MRAEELQAIIDEPERRAEVSARELTRTLLDRITDYQPHINAFFTISEELALSDAKRVDAARQAGQRLPLDGLPVAIKDNIDVGGVRTTVGAKFFEDHVPRQDSEVVRRLRAAGAIILGKAALHEFVYGVTCNNPFYGACRNPWDLERIPGGSSGGSGAALAADLCIGALGSDTGGSVRIPAAVDGVTGLRTTFGSVSNRGVFPVSWSFDTVGPMARAVTDVARLLWVIAGFDAEDPRSVDHPIADPLLDLESGISGLRIGIPTNYFFDDIDPEINSFVRAAVKEFAAFGVEIVEIEVPGAEEANEICTLIIRADALALHRERYEKQPELFGEDIYRRLTLGKQVSGADYSAMEQRMYEWRQEIRNTFKSVDLILSATTNTVAPTIADSETIATTAQLTHFTYPWSLAHLPAISLPCGVSSGGMPIGLQLAAGAWQEPVLLRAGFAYQQATNWHRRRPPEHPRAAS